MSSLLLHGYQADIRDVEKERDMCQTQEMRIIPVMMGFIGLPHQVELSRSAGTATSSGAK